LSLCERHRCRRRNAKHRQSHRYLTTVQHDVFFLLANDATWVGPDALKGKVPRSLMSIWKAPARRAQGASDRISTSTRLIPMMREYTVFNVDQCDSLPDRIITGKPPRKSSATAQAFKGTLGGFYVYKSRIEIIRGLSFPSADALLRIACCGRLPSASRATRP
jgi:hypothetical protein